MNILYLTNSPIIGGAEISLLNHIKYLNKEKYKATLVCSNVLLEKAREIEDIKVIPMEFYILNRKNPLIIYRYIKMVRDVVKIIKKQKIDIIHTNSVKAHYIGVAASIITKKPLIWWMRDETINKLIYNLTKNIPKKIIFISRYLMSLFPKSPNNIVIHNGTDIYKKLIDENEKDDLRKHFGSENKVVVLCSERLVRWKGVQVLVESIDMIKDLDFICLISGTGKGQREDIEFDLIKKVSELGLTDKVKFLGWRSDINKLYQIADIVVHPVIEPEPFGLVLIEAMSFRIPVIASNIGGPTEIITADDEGYLIEPNDPYTLAEKLRDLISSKYLRDKIGEKGREKVLSSFTQEIETLSVEHLYNSISQ